MRCNAAAKGIQGDGKVQLCISKEQFDAINDKAGDSLVRIPPYLPPQLFSQDGCTRKTWSICQLYLS